MLGSEWDSDEEDCDEEGSEEDVDEGSELDSLEELESGRALWLSS